MTLKKRIIYADISATLTLAVYYDDVLHPYLYQKHAAVILTHDTVIDANMIYI